MRTVRDQAESGAGHLRPSSVREREWSRECQPGAQVLRGRTIAVDSVNSILHAYVLLLARRAGYDPNDIRIATMAPTSVLAAYAARQIDGFALSMPWPLPPVLDGTAILLLVSVYIRRAGTEELV